MGLCPSRDEFDVPEGDDIAEDERIVKPRRREQKEPTYKIVLLGESNTGKTSLVSRITRNTFQSDPSNTIGATFQVFNATVNGKTVKLELWDTAGQERYRSLTPMYMRGAHAGIIVYDITNMSSFDGMKQWAEDLKSTALDGCVVAIVGNKTDLADKRIIEKTVGEEYLKTVENRPPDPTNNGRLVFAGFSEVSAKTGEGVMESFDVLCHKLVATHTLPTSSVSTKS
ncbi:GTP-binding protein ypt5 [Pelomyxa schiedti]|nr:GTP-binding protein ypt5 [Pelomyxa schiedti]